MPEFRAVSAFDGLLRPVAFGAGVSVIDLDGLGIASVQALKGTTDALIVALGSTLGLAVRDAPQRFAANGRAAIGIGRGRWLVTAEGAANSFAAELEAALDGLAAVNDQSDGYALLGLAGPSVREVLARGVNLDLHDRAFPVGSVATTAIAHIGVTLWRTDDGAGAPVFEMALFRSMVGSFVHWLEASAGGFGLAVTERG